MNLSPFSSLLYIYSLLHFFFPSNFLHLPLFIPFFNISFTIPFSLSLIHYFVLIPTIFYFLRSFILHCISFFLIYSIHPSRMNEQHVFPLAIFLTIRFHDGRRKGNNSTFTLWRNTSITSNCSLKELETFLTLNNNSLPLYFNFSHDTLKPYQLLSWANKHRTHTVPLLNCHTM